VGWFRTALDERGALYRGVADLEVDTSSMNPDASAGTILAALPGPIPSEHAERA
jgi:hypothetical protein